MISHCQACTSILFFISTKEHSTGIHSVVDEAQHYAEWKKSVTEDQCWICPGHRDLQRQRVGYWGKQIVSAEGS